MRFDGGDLDCSVNKTLCAGVLCKRIRGEDGRLIGIVLVFRDASQEKRTRARSEFLAKAGEALVSSLDHEATLANVARLTVPMFCRLVLHRPARRENGRASPGGGRLHGSGQSAAHTT